MPVITQEFNHVCASFTKIAAGAYDHTSALKTSATIVKEASQYFFDDLKDVLASIPGLDITFSDQSTYEKSTIMPSFSIWGLTLSPFVAHLNTNANCNFLVPFIARHYVPNPLVYSYKYLVTSDTDSKDKQPYFANIGKNSVEYQDINYTIEIRYNTDYLLIEYRPYVDKTIKFTLCCLIKGQDINGKDVVYESGGCNTYAKSNPWSYTDWAVYHHLVWSESPAVNPYGYGIIFPASDNLHAVNRADMSRGTIFMDLVNNTYYPHYSKIGLNDSNNIIFSRPICCWGRVTFSDNILTGPINLAFDVDYEINGETYYCPGDYNAIISATSASLNCNQCAMRFLLKI